MQLLLPLPPQNHHANLVTFIKPPQKAFKMDHYFFSGKKKKDNLSSIIDENACCPFFFKAKCIYQIEYVKELF